MSNLNRLNPNRGFKFSTASAGIGAGVIFLVIGIYVLLAYFVGFWPFSGDDLPEIGKKCKEDKDCTDGDTDFHDHMECKDKKCAIKTLSKSNTLYGEACTSDSDCNTAGSALRGYLRCDNTTEKCALKTTMRDTTFGQSCSKAADCRIGNSKFNDYMYCNAGECSLYDGTYKAANAECQINKQCQSGTCGDGGECTAP